MKVELETPDKPEIVSMAARLRIDQDSVCGKCLRIWAWADRNSVDGSAMAITEAFIDRLTNRKGFASALRSVGWLAGEDGNLTFPGFLRHNGSSAKARADTNRRVANFREGKKGVTAKPLPKPLPEKRREENEESELSSLPPKADALARGGLDQLIKKIKSLRPGWQKPSVLTAMEKPVFAANCDVFACFDDADWTLQREYLAARLPEGDPGWQPRSLLKYLESPTDVMSHAERWKGKQRPPLRVVSKDSTETSGPPLTAEERKELLSLKANP